MNNNALVVIDIVFEKSKASALTSEMFAYYASKGCDVKKIGRLYRWGKYNIKN